MVPSMMGFASLSISFWGYALKTACFVLNNILSKSVSKILYEIWLGHRLITLRSGGVWLMSNNYKLTSSDLDSISIIL